jgi:hypothetical protein
LSAGLGAVLPPPTFTEKEMPKLEDVRLGVSPLTDTVMMGTLKDEMTWRGKRDCTSEFCGALLTWIPPGSVREIGSRAGKRYEIEVRELAPNV